MKQRGRILLRWSAWMLLLSQVAAALALGALLAEPSHPESVTAVVRPVATNQQLIRFSIPLPPGLLLENVDLAASYGTNVAHAFVRALSWHPTTPKSVRRALVTFPFRFVDLSPVRFEFRPAVADSVPSPSIESRFRLNLQLRDETLFLNNAEGLAITARPLWPSRLTNLPARMEVVESNAVYRWYRWHFADPVWPRIVEVRLDALGTVAAVAHLQRAQAGDARAPAFGWRLDVDRSKRGLGEAELERNGIHQATIRFAQDAKSVGAGEEFSHSFSNGEPAEVHFGRSDYRLTHPAGPYKGCGRITGNLDVAGLHYSYWRCVEGDRVPMQAWAWQRAEWVLGPAAQAPLTPMLESPHALSLNWQAWDVLYGSGPPLDLSRDPELERLLEYHHQAIVQCVARGHDWGNVTGYNDGAPTGPIFGMNRLNHNMPVFAESWRRNDHRLRDVALLWCNNFFDQSIWWGPGQTGGTRYNNVRAQNRRPPDDDNTYMWRSNDAVHFCTKGYDSFWIAYEETGDPRMEEAFLAQTRYAAEHVHADRGECRNVGDVRDFMSAYAWLAQTNYLNQAVRLFRELRTKVSTGDLFDQGGKPITANPPFIEDDATGSRFGYAKPYIIGYALAGLPALGHQFPDEPQLRPVVQAVADFLATSQDPIGGWRYPHPRSSSVFLSQAMEHAWQLVQADQWLGPQAKHLDAIERVLRQRILGWRETGKIFSNLTGWESATGLIKNGTELNPRYARPEDRDAARDYVEGRAGFGSAPPEGLVYFPEVLAFYLKHRPVSRLLAAAEPDQPLGKVLARVK